MRDINRMTSSNLAFANQAAAQEIVQAEKMAALLDCWTTWQMHPSRRTIQLTSWS
jgi:hypothetical protein